MALVTDQPSEPGKVAIMPPPSTGFPPVIDVIQRLVRTADAVVARGYLSLFRERNALITFLFHSLFRDEAEMARNLIDPIQKTTVAHFRSLIRYYRDHGYQFITPDQLLAGLGPDGKYAMLTFDDGYFNNTLALPVLAEFDVPAVFFISTDHVLKNKCFWWDVLYRELSARGLSTRRIYRDGVGLKSRRTDRIEAELTEHFGPTAFEPRGDVDRPFTPDELRTFARDPHVYIGNHTADHAILTNYSPEEVRTQLIGAGNAPDAHGQDTEVNRLSQRSAFTGDSSSLRTGGSEGRIHDPAGEMRLAAVAPLTPVVPAWSLRAAW